ncbi:hypothetical protein D3C76_1652790 [compost metagenome]
MFARQDIDRRGAFQRSDVAATGAEHDDSVQVVAAGDGAGFGNRHRHGKAANDQRDSAGQRGVMEHG